MEKERNSKVIAIVALLVGVIGLAIGFAAFSNTLTIQSSATVTADEGNFNVDFSSVENDVTAGKVTANPSTLGEDATIDNTGDPTISGLKANFTAPGQTVSYTFYARNAGEYDAYLTSLVFANVDNSTPKKCSAIEPAEGEEGKTIASDELVAAACEGISISVDVGTLTNVTGSQATIEDHVLGKTAAEQIVVTISYAADAQRADGDISVAFGDITLKYDSVDSDGTATE